MEDVNTTFDREFGRAEYDTKIARLVRNIRATDHGDHDAVGAWKAAVGKMREGDHYLLTMIDQASAPEMSWGHIARLAVMVLVGTGIMLGAIWFFMFR
jgi:hypothetical protein